jgi:hypothetical protein
VVQQYLIIGLGALVILFFAVKGAIDMAASLDYAEGVFPRLKRWSESKKWHRIVLMLTLLFYIGTLYELLSQPPLPPIVNPDPAVLVIAPIVQENVALKFRITALTVPESPTSLRRRTIKLADEILAWEQERYEHHPPYAYPDKQSDPNPTPERQKLIDTCLKYDGETVDQFNRRFKEEWIEIVRKYELENVKVGTLVNDAEQNHPAQDASMGAQFVPVQMDNGTYYSALSRFRELAYHVDANGHRIDFH